MKTGEKYTALEIIKAAGFDGSSIGKFRVVIGGISGIVKPEHKIRIAEGTTELGVTVGVETKTIKIK